MCPPEEFKPSRHGRRGGQALQLHRRSSTRGAGPARLWRPAAQWRRIRPFPLHQDAQEQASVCQGAGSPLHGSGDVHDHLPVPRLHRGTDGGAGHRPGRLPDCLGDLGRDHGDEGIQGVPHRTGHPVAGASQGGSRKQGIGREPGGLRQEELFQQQARPAGPDTDRRHPRLVQAEEHQAPEHGDPPDTDGTVPRGGEAGVAAESSLYLRMLRHPHRSGARGQDARPGPQDQQVFRSARIPVPGSVLPHQRRYAFRVRRRAGNPPGKAT